MTSQDDTSTGTRPVTYNDAQSAYRGTADARERHDELTNRDLSARSLATLKARGTYDPAKHGDADPAPLTLDEHLEVIAAGEVLARYYRHPSQVDHAVKAGASWEQIAQAAGGSPEQVRQEYREWADGQHRLWAHYEGKLGMSDAAYDEALRAAGPGPAAAEEGGR